VAEVMADLLIVCGEALFFGACLLYAWALDGV